MAWPAVMHARLVRKLPALAPVAVASGVVALGLRVTFEDDRFPQELVSFTAAEAGEVHVATESPMASANESKLTNFICFLP